MYEGFEGVDTGDALLLESTGFEDSFGRLTEPVFSSSKYSRMSLHGVHKPQSYLLHKLR